MNRAIKSLLLLSLFLTMATTAYCDPADNYFDSANVKRGKGNWDGAISDFTKVIQLKPDDAEAYKNRGYAKEQKGDLDGAIADFTKAIQLKPDWRTYAVRGGVKQAKGDLDGAIADYTRTIELKPDSADIYYNRGNAKKAKGDLDGAIADYTRTIQFNPDWKPEFVASVFNNRGMARKAKGDLVGANADFTKAKELKASLKPGDTAPDFSSRTLDDKPLILSNFRGKFVLLDFWATWCGPCVAEMPNIKATYDAFGKDERFVMISLSLDSESAAPTKYASKHGMAWTQGFLGNWSDDEVTGKYRVTGIPAIFLIGPDGKVLATNLRGSEIKKAVAAALAR